MLNTVTRQDNSGVAAATTTTIFCDPNATFHQIKINKNSATSGTLALTGKSAQASTAETIYDSNGAAISFNCASSTPQTYVFCAAMDTFIITPTALNGTYNVHYCAW